MKDLKNRNFQLWEYHVSHGSLLIRSPKRGEDTKNIDIVFAGVEYMALPRHLKSVELDDASSREISELSILVGRKLEGKAVTIIIAEGTRYSVVATGMRITENDMDIFHSPF